MASSLGVEKALNNSEGATYWEKARPAGERNGVLARKANYSADKASQWVIQIV